VQTVIVRASDPVTTLNSVIADQVGPQRYNLWFKNVTQFTFTGEFLRVGVANPFVGEWIERHFAGAITQAAKQVTGNDFTLSFSIDPSLAANTGRKQPDRQADFVANNPQRQARLSRRNGSCQPTLKLAGKLENFIVGASNRLAYGAVQSVIEHPAGHYNPLFIHGGCGLGKTHLAQSICNGIKQSHPSLVWRYCTGEEFTNDFVFSVRSREPDAFRHRYRNIDVLVVDDIHYVANKRATQEVFLHTFNAIFTTGKQVVLTSDAHPKMIGHLSEHLVNRLVSGMVVRIDSPGMKVRSGVLRQKAQRMRVDIPDPVIAWIAENFRSNIRELEGAVLKVTATAHLTRQPITLSLAQQALNDTFRDTAPLIRLSDIESIVAIFFGLTPTDLHTTRKTRTIALARGIAMYLARKHTKMSYPEIGRFMGKKNHSTVLLARRRISNKLQGDETVRWLTPAGEKEMNLAVLIQDLEEQLGQV